MKTRGGATTRGASSRDAPQAVARIPGDAITALAADGRALEILRAMGHAAPRRTLAAALRAAAALNGPGMGGPLATEPSLADRLARLEPVESPAELAVRGPDVR